jgi:hypothetical protein
MAPVTDITSVDIMLTPQFYTMKKEVLPVKYAFQAKRIAASLFDGLIERSENTEYFVYKEGDAWVFIAYNMREILDFLHQKQIRPAQIRKLFFAQQFLHEITQPMALDEEYALVVLDQVVVLVSGNVLSQKPVSGIGSLKRPGKGLKPESEHTGWLTQKQALTMMVILVLFSIVWLIEGWRFKEENQKLEEKSMTLYADYPALQNAYTRDNIAQKYRTIDTVERHKREVIRKIATMIFKGVTLEKFNMDTKEFIAHFSVKSKKIGDRLSQLAKKAGYRVKQEADKVVIEGTL